jgi:hypothetical protein
MREDRSAHAGIVMVVLLAVFAFPGTAHAHEKWFHDAEPYPTNWAQAFKFPQVIGVTVAVLLTVALGFVWRKFGRRNVLPGPEALGATPEGFARFYAMVPLILGLHVGLPLIVQGIMGQLFSPNNQLAGPWVYWLGVVQIGIGLSLIYGGFARLGGAMLCLLWLIGAGVVGLEEMLENAHYLGFGAFFILTGRGPYAVDRLLFPRLEPTVVIRRRDLDPAVWVLRDLVVLPA